MLHKKLLHVQRKLCVNKNVSYKSYVAQQNNVSHKKIVCGNQKRGSGRVNMFSAAQKRNTCRQKIIPIVCKYL